MGDRGTIVRKQIPHDKCMAFVAKELGTGSTPYGVEKLDYAIDTSKLARDLYVSRFGDSIDGLLRKDMVEAWLTWTVSMLSTTQLFGATSYDDILKFSDSELAGYVPLINPDFRLPSLKRIHQHLVGLAQAGHQGKIIVLARAMAMILYHGDSGGTIRDNQDVLFELATYLKQLYPVSSWSDKTMSLWRQCRDIVNAWADQKILNWNLSRPYIHWKFDPEARVNDLVNVFNLN